MAVDLSELRRAFRRQFGEEPQVVRAPGRVNLIGEHTDYNGGFVLPMAIDRSLYGAFTTRDDAEATVYALDFGRVVRFSLAAVEADRSEPWSNYVRGVALALRQAGVALRGLNLVLHGDVPIGSGLSSSAALEVCSALAFLAAAGRDMARTELAVLCQRAESQFVGVNCGIMDQFVCALAKRGHALLVDCRDLSYRHLPIDDGEVKVVIVDSMIRRELSDSRYNVRRQECEKARQYLGAVSLRDLDLSDGELARSGFPEALRRRVAHVTSENRRVQEFARAISVGDWSAAGELMSASHRSLRDDYAVSTPELDFLVATALQVEGVFGARLTGAGFGGCIVSLVRSAAVPAFRRQVRERYRTETGLDPEIYVSGAADGAGPV